MRDVIIATIIVLLITLIMTVSCEASSAVTLEVDKDRLVTIDGPIGDEALDHAETIALLSAKNKSPIFIFINSGGGSLMTGSKIIQAINIAKTRSVQVKCLVTSDAMSMALAIFAHCTERYAFATASLMWHPVRYNFSEDRTYTHDDLDQIARLVRANTQELWEPLKQVLKISPDLFKYHLELGTIHTAANLVKLSPSFLTIVEDATNLPFTFIKRRSSTDAKGNQVRPTETTGRSFMPGVPSSLGKGWLLRGG